MITYFRMKQYFNQTRLLENRFNFSLRAIYIDLNSIMFSQSVFTLTRTDIAIAEARPSTVYTVDRLVCVLLLLCQVSQMCNFIIPDHQEQSPRYQDSLQISPVIVAEKHCWNSDAGQVKANCFWSNEAWGARLTFISVTAPSSGSG